MDSGSRFWLYLGLILKRYPYEQYLYWKQGQKEDMSYKTIRELEDEIYRLQKLVHDLDQEVARLLEILKTYNISL